MSEISYINKKIYDNLKINDLEEKINSSKNQIKIEDNDFSFKRLSALQLLIKTHSGIEELCKI